LRDGYLIHHFGLRNGRIFSIILAIKKLTFPSSINIKFFFSSGIFKTLN